MARLGSLLAVVLGASMAPASPSVGYAQATGYFEQASRPTRYQPLNLLDGREATAWCSPTGDPLNELLTFGFSVPVRLEELRITTGNNLDPSTFAGFARARKLLVHAGKETRTVEVEDRPGPQAVRLEPPLMAARLRVEVVDQFPAEEPDQPVCLSDLVFVAGGKPLNGPWLAARLKYDPASAPLLGTWYAGYEGAPDRFLSFHFDGTFRASFEPFDPSARPPRALEGTYDADAGRVVFQVQGRRSVVTASRVPGKAGGSILGLLGSAVPADLQGPWRSVP
jgi:hypothetical protein